MTDAPTMTISTELFRKMRFALNIADRTIDDRGFAGIDQNPRGVRDIVGSALMAANRIDVPQEKL